MDVSKETLIKQVLYTAIGVVSQTLFYGVYFPVVVACSYVMISKGLKVKARLVSLAIMLYMFTMASAYWAISVARLIAKICATFSDNPHEDLGFWIYPLFNAFLTISYGLTDSVIVWRCWVLCGKSTYSSKKLWLVPFFLLGMAWMSAFAIIVLRSMTIPSLKKGPLEPHLLTNAINYAQVIGAILTITTNTVATGIVGFKAWQHRQSLAEYVQGLDKATSKAQKVLTLMLETGLLYLASSTFTLISSVIRLPDGSTLGDIYTPINVQLAGILPTLMFLLVARKQDMDSSMAFSGYRSEIVVSAIQFHSNPANIEVKE